MKHDSAVFHCPSQHCTLHLEASVQVHIQNATLAGGVAVGSAANLNIAPAGALAIGIASGCLSTLGYAYSQPFLEKNIGLRDTCGVINLHAGPGIIGGIAAGKPALDSCLLQHHKSIIMHGRIGHSTALT